MEQFLRQNVDQNIFLKLTALNPDIFFSNPGKQCSMTLIPADQTLLQDTALWMRPPFEVFPYRKTVLSTFKVQ